MTRHWLALAVLCCAACAIPAAARADDNACGLFTQSAHFGQILGGSNYQVLKNLTAKSSSKNTDGALHSICNGTIWAGAKPTSRTAAVHALMAGTASLFAVETLEPDHASPYAAKWISKSYPQLIAGSLLGNLPELGALKRANVRRFKPKAYGLGAGGVLANPLPGVVAGDAVWWNAKKHQIVMVVIGAGQRRPIVSELNRLGAIVTGAFGMQH